MQASTASALASLYTYESRVPAIAHTKAEGLKQYYGADKAIARYFTLHQTADLRHAQVWREAIEAELTAHPEQADTALDAAEATATTLWSTLSGIERERQRARSVAA
jgi:pyrroloquinoline-quinone synthase